MPVAIVKRKTKPFSESIKNGDKLEYRLLNADCCQTAVARSNNIADDDATISGQGSVNALLSHLNRKGYD
jgi:hypothetical protein